MSQNALRPLPVAQTLEAWHLHRQRLLTEWEALLGGPVPKPPESRLETLEEETLPRVLRRRVRYQTEPDIWTEAYLLLPRSPGVVVFHATTDHHIRQPAGLEGTEEKHLGLKLAENGFVTLCPRCFLWDDPQLPIAERTPRMQRRHPGWTGMRKMLWDGQRALDVLAGLPEVDAGRLGAIGHSLGAKETLYLTAFDPRIQAGVFSEGGIGLALSNWEAPWYLGQQIKHPDFRYDHHELLALCAPRPFLILGGDSADGEVSKPYIEAARPIYALANASDQLRLVNHRKGHEIPPEAWEASLDWLKRSLLPASKAG
jgi:predicted esterase